MGGVQTVTLSLATGFAEWGKTHPGDSIEVVLVTQTPANGMDDSKFPFRVLRHPGQRELIRHIRSADVLHSGRPRAPASAVCAPCWNAGGRRASRLSVRLPEWPAALRARPHDLPGPLHGRPLWKMSAMQCGSTWDGSPACAIFVSTFPRRWLCARAAGNIAVSNHVAMRIAPPAHANDLSRNRKRLPRRRRIHRPAARLPSASATRAVWSRRRASQYFSMPRNISRTLAIPFHLTFIGDGTQRAELEAVRSAARPARPRHVYRRIARLRTSTAALAQIQVLVMPSRWEETAGLAAIEQMMRGGVVVAADIGGLSEVVGDAGLKFSVTTRSPGRAPAANL